MANYIATDTDLTSVANAIRTKGGTSASLAFPQGFVDAVEAIETGGKSGWQRPAEWPDYSKLHLVEDEIEAEFFTYDNREARAGITVGGGFSVKTSAKAYITIDRVSIGPDGTITVLDTATGSTNVGTIRCDYRFTIPADAGDFVCYRVTPAPGVHITEIGMYSPAGMTYAYMQRCVERYGNLPFCRYFYGFGSAYNGWGCQHLVSDTILAMPNDVSFIEYQYSYKLVNLPADGWKKVTFTGPSANLFDGCASLNQIPVDKLDLSAATSLNGFASDSGVESLDLSDVSVAACTGLNAFLQTARRIKWFRGPKNIPNLSVGVLNDFFNGCYSLDVVEFDSTFGSNTNGIGDRWFNNSKSIKALILRAESVVPLYAASAVNAFMKAGGGYCYVPQSVLADYKAATNWSTVANYILPIEGSFWETHHADGSLIEEVAT